MEIRPIDRDVPEGGRAPRIRDGDRACRRHDRRGIDEDRPTAFEWKTKAATRIQVDIDEARLIHVPGGDALQPEHESIVEERTGPLLCHAQRARLLAAC